MPTFQHDGIDFHYVDNEAGLPFVFQHGLGADYSHPAGVYRGQTGIRLLTLENRGHGLTTGAGVPHNISFNSFADDVFALLKYLNTRPFVAGGISMGAGVALNLAIRYPAWVMGLVLIRPAWLDKPNPENLKPFAVLARYLSDWGAVEGLKQYRLSKEYTTMLKVNPQAAQMLEEAFLQPGATERAICYQEMPNDVPNHDPQDWRKISVPALVVGCEDDTVHPYFMAQKLAEAIPGAELVKVTAKSVDAVRYDRETEKAMIDFLVKNYIIQGRHKSPGHPW